MLPRLTSSRLRLGAIATALVLLGGLSPVIHAWAHAMSDDGTYVVADCVECQIARAPALAADAPVLSLAAATNIATTPVSTDAPNARPHRFSAPSRAPPA
jgi:hypothetical protein